MLTNKTEEKEEEGHLLSAQAIIEHPEPTALLEVNEHLPFLKKTEILQHIRDCIMLNINFHCNDTLKVYKNQNS